MDDPPLLCRVVTPEGKVLEERAFFAVIPAHDGEIGILQGRAPLVAQLAAGEFRMVGHDKQETRLFVDGGFGEVARDEVTILTPRAEPIASLDSSAIERELAEANALVPTTDEGFADKQERLLRGFARRRMLGR